MAGNIKGITIEFRGDTTKLDKALRDVNNETRGIDKELRAVNNSLKFNPTSVELWRQKQQLLTQKVTETKEKLDLLKQAQSQLDDNTAIDKESAEYRELQRDIIETESKLKHFEGELQKIGNANLQALGAQLDNIGDKMKSVGTSMTTHVTAPIVAGYTAAMKYASDYEENLNKIDVAFGDSAGEVREWADTARDSFGLSKVQATEAVSAFGALGKGIGLTDGEAAQMATTLAGLSADLGSYFNVGTEESAKALEGIFTGESEALKKFGVVMTDTNLKQFAADQGLVWEQMSEGEKTALRYQYVLAKTKDAQGDFSRTSGGTANSIKTFQATVQDLATSIGTTLVPIITPVIQKFTGLLEKFDSLSPGAKKVITIIGLVVAAIGPLLVILGTLASAIGSIIAIAPMVGSAFSVMLGPVGIVIGIIAALIAIGVLLYKNWDTIKAKLIVFKDFMVSVFTAIKDKVAAVFNAIKNAIMTPIRTAVDFVKKMIDKIKGFFNFKVSLPHIKLPHFSIKPKGWKLGDLLKGSIPHLGIDWYAQGGIFNSPSVIGVGEAGPEAVLPIEKLQVMLGSMADDIVNGVNMGMRLAGAGEQVITIPIYLYPSGAKMGEETVKIYDQYKRILG